MPTSFGVGIEEAVMQAATAAQPILVDLLEQLSFHQDGVREYHKDQIIYAPNSREDLRVHLIQKGRVITKSLTNKGELVGLEMLEQEEIFGLEALVGSYTTIARCAENTRTLSWDVGTLDQLQRSNPVLAIGLAQTAIRRMGYYQRRVEELASLGIQERLAIFLIEKVRKSPGNVGADGSIALPPITHEVLAQFVGTSREIVTHYMNIFRRAGYVVFDRKHIRVFNTIGFADLARTRNDDFDIRFRESET